MDRRRVSVQWFSGTILTGLCGAALMGGAVYAALDGETNFATVPERVEATLRGAVAGISDRIANSTRKTDRLPPPGEANAARQIIRVSTTTRGSGNREIVRVRPFIRVAGNLSLSLSDLSATIPPFNAQKLIARSDGICGFRGRCRGRARCGSLLLHARSRLGLAAGKDRCRGLAGRGARPRARSRQLGQRLRPEAADHGIDSRDGLRSRAQSRPLCGLECPDRAGKHHAVAQDHHARLRRDRLERTHHRAQKGRFGLGDAARDGRQRGEIKAITAASAGAARTAARRTATSCACCSRQRATPGGCSRSAWLSPPIPASRPWLPGPTKANTSRSTCAAPTAWLPQR